jgi:hypothetical protein
VRSSQSGTGLRDFPLRLLHEVAPQIDSIDRQRVVAGHAELAWPERLRGRRCIAWRREKRRK